MISTVVPDSPHKIFIGGLPNYLNEDQVFYTYNIGSFIFQIKIKEHVCTYTGHSETIHGFNLNSVSQNERNCSRAFVIFVFPFLFKNFLFERKFQLKINADFINTHCLGF